MNFILRWFARQRLRRVLVEANRIAEHGTPADTQRFQALLAKIMPLSRRVGHKETMRIGLAILRPTAQEMCDALKPDSSMIQ